MFLRNDRSERLRSRVFQRGAACIALVTLSIAVSTGAAAQREPTAQALFYEAVELMKRELYFEASRELEKSLHQEDRASTRYMLAQCYEFTERPAAAWSLFCSVANEPIPQEQSSYDPANPRKQSLRQKALDRAARLFPEVPNLRIDIPGGTASRHDINIWVDDFMLAHKDVGQWIHVEPGYHVVKVSREGKSAWETDLQIRPTCDSVTITTPSFPAPRAQPSRASPQALQPGTLYPGTLYPGTLYPGTLYPGTLSMISVGLAGMIVGTFAGIRALVLDTYRDNACRPSSDPNDPPPCPLFMKDTLAAADAEATTYATTSTASFAVGGAALAFAVAWELVRRPASAAAGPTIGISAALDAQSARWTVQGTF